VGGAVRRVDSQSSLVHAENFSHAGAPGGPPRAPPRLAERHDGCRAGPLETSTGFVRAIPEVEGHGNQAGTKNRQNTRQRLGAVRQPDRNAIAVTASTADEVGGEMIGGSDECGIRERRLPQRMAFGRA